LDSFGKGKVKVTRSWIDRLPESKMSKSSWRGHQSTLDKKREFILKKGDKVSFRTNGFLQLSVADTGAGMSQQQMADVFEQGTQFNVNELQAGQGSGLGLYIAKGIMKQHDGDLTVSSDGLGKGITFTITLPVYHHTKWNDECKEMESDHFHFRASKATVRPQQNCSNLRILVVDDSDTNRKFLTRILENRGHTCNQARNGREAVDAITKSMECDDFVDDGSSNSTGLYDAVLLDYEMPVMNGPDAAKEMRDLGSDTFIVGITGNLLPEDVEHFMSQGANEVLPKPFNISDLEDILMEYGVGILISAIIYPSKFLSRGIQV